jgi:hypothetical protein
MTDPTVPHHSLIGRNLRVLNADHDLLNVRDLKTGEQFWIESRYSFKVFRTERRREAR